MSGVTRVVVDVPNEWIAEARAEIRAYPTMRESTHWAGGIGCLVVDAAPQPVDVTITLTPEEAAATVEEFLDSATERDGLDDRLLCALAAALRAQGYGATPAPLPVIAPGDTFTHEGREVKAQSDGPAHLWVFGPSIGARHLTTDGTTVRTLDKDTPLRLALVESARAAGFAMPWDATTTKDQP